MLMTWSYVCVINDLVRGFILTIIRFMGESGLWAPGPPFALRLVTLCVTSVFRVWMDWFVIKFSTHTAYFYSTLIPDYLYRITLINSEMWSSKKSNMVWCSKNHHKEIVMLVYKIKICSMNIIAPWKIHKTILFSSVFIIWTGFFIGKKYKYLNILQQQKKCKKYLSGAFDQRPRSSKDICVHFSHILS